MFRVFLYAAPERRQVVIGVSINFAARLFPSGEFRLAVF
jgi:hypothetical protein